MSFELEESVLGNYIGFKNGKSSPDRDDIGSSAVFGSNGIIGYVNQTNSPENILIVGRVGSYCGSVYHSKEKCWVTDNAIMGIPKFNNESEFWYYLLIKLDLNNYRSGSGQPLLNQATLSSIPIKVPKCPEVRAEIGKRLMMVDNKIQLNRQTNQTLEQIAQAIFKSWFVDFEPVKAKMAVKQAGASAVQIEQAAICAISGKTTEQLAQLDPQTLQQLKTAAALFPDALVDSELGEIPEGWEAIPLYDTAEYINGISFKNEDFSDDKSGLPIIKIAELKQGLGPNTKYTTIEVNSKYFITDDDVLYSWSGSPETSLEVFKWFGGDGWLNQHIFKLNFKNSEHKYFTYYLLKHMKPVLIATAQQKQTTGLGHVTVADMKRIKVTLPSEQVLLEFMRIVSPLYEKGSNAEKESRELIGIRDNLLPELLSGAINLSCGVNA
jgi:type I restriction enzyme S subunit